MNHVKILDSTKVHRIFKLIERDQFHLKSIEVCVWWDFALILQNEFAYDLLSMISNRSLERLIWRKVQLTFNKVKYLRKKLFFWWNRFIYLYGKQTINESNIQKMKCNISNGVLLFLTFFSCSPINFLMIVFVCYKGIYIRNFYEVVRNWKMWVPNVFYWDHSLFHRVNTI